VSADIKFCGLTGSADAREAARLGAAFVGAVFAGGPRRIEPSLARDVLAAGAPARRVGVFGDRPAHLIAAEAAAAELDVVQLHADPEAETIEWLRRYFGGEVWAVVRPDASRLPAHASELFATADAVLLDARAPGMLGGTGMTLEWDALADALAGVRRAARLVLAGGLTADNVGRAIALIRPDVVDVSSGVESAPGVKDHVRMRAFAAAVRDARQVTPA
jgi:phosphoribosylanthranilate isomerase